MEYNIKITGSGTKEEIIAALQTIIQDIEATRENQLDGVEWENATLMTVINFEDEGQDRKSYTDDQDRKSYTAN